MKYMASITCILQTEWILLDVVYNEKIDCILTCSYCDICDRVLICDVRFVNSHRSRHFENHKNLKIIISKIIKEKGKRITIVDIIWFVVREKPLFTMKFVVFTKIHYRSPIELLADIGIDTDSEFEIEY